MGPILDGVSEHMADYPEETFSCGSAAGRRRRRSQEDRYEVVVSYRPLALQAGDATPRPASRTVGELHASLPRLRSDRGERFTSKGIPVVDDIVAARRHDRPSHLAKLTDAHQDRPHVPVNTGGNTDFTCSIAAVSVPRRSEDGSGAVGHSGRSQRATCTSGRATTCWQGTTICFLRIEGRLATCRWSWSFVSVQDSPNSAGGDRRDPLPAGA
jgi:myo-inositol-1-phosphate synthase